jgi:acyl carrier protein
MEEKVKQILADFLGLDAAAIDDSIAMDNTESWDSLAHLNICLGLEQEFQVTFQPTEMEAMTSFYDIVQVLQEKTPQ